LRRAAGCQPRRLCLIRHQQCRCSHQYPSVSFRLSSRFPIRCRARLQLGSVQLRFAVRIRFLLDSHASQRRHFTCEHLYSPLSS
jgi:hypothetical protein